jgi:lactose/cellobiose-specific phosphotransferase system IIC component
MPEDHSMASPFRDPDDAPGATVDAGTVPPDAAAPGPNSAVQKASPFAFLLKDYPLLRTCRHAVMLLMPLLLAAALAVLINNFPVQSYQDFMSDTFGSVWKQPGRLLYEGTIEIIALAASFSLSGCLVNLHNERYPDSAVMPAIGGITSFSCLFIMMAPTFSPVGVVLPWAGLRGLFGSLVITFCVCWLLLHLCRVRWLRSSLHSEGSDPLLPMLFSTIWPVLITLCVCVAARTVLSALGFDSLHQAFYDAIRTSFQNARDSFGLGAAYAFLVQLFWFLGIHGADLLDPITHNVLVKAMEANSLALNLHQTPPHILTKYFFDVYLHVGGAGATLGLVLAIFLRGRDQSSRRVAILSALPTAFNINEILLFGLPVVLNPAYLIPFLLTPLILLVISYAAVVTGLAPLPVFQVDWTTPPIINAYLATGSWRGVALQLINTLVSVLVYLPFVRLADNAKAEDRQKSFQTLVDVARKHVRGPAGKLCSDRPGSVGTLARSLAEDMRIGLESKDGNIQLHYQPRVDVVNNSIPGVEALLRWHHPLFGLIPAALTLAIAEDSSQSKRLANEVTLMAFEQQNEWRNSGIETTTCLNISEEQLQDHLFPLLLRELFDRFALPQEAILLEIREELALEPNGRYVEAIEALHEVGAAIAVDDFGKGYQAISHVKRLPLTELQIDRALVRDVATDRLSQDVAGTIQELCFRLGIKTSVEHVETREQLEMLLELNYGTFQGYYFSKPVSAAECTRFLKEFPKQGVQMGRI